MKAIDANVPLNCTTPFPSRPETTFPATTIGEPPKNQFGPPAWKVGVASNVKVAGTDGLPRLQIANTGFVIGDAKLGIVCSVLWPLSRKSSPVASGDVVTVPPMNELSGVQMGVVPSTTAFSSSPVYVTPMPPSEPDAEPPGVPAEKLIPVAQMVSARAGAASPPTQDNRCTSA